MEHRFLGASIGAFRVLRDLSKSKEGEEARLAAREWIEDAKLDQRIY